MIRAIVAIRICRIPSYTLFYTVVQAYWCIRLCVPDTDIAVLAAGPVCGRRRRHVAICFEVVGQPVARQIWGEITRCQAQLGAAPNLEP